MKTCEDVMQSELEDKLGNPFTPEMAKLFCDCYMQEIFSRGMNSDEEGAFVGSSEWKQLFNRCHDGVAASHNP